MQDELDYKTICAAVANEEWAVQKVVERFSDQIDIFATTYMRLPDGSKKKIIDEDMRQELILKLIEDISNFPLSDMDNGDGDEEA